MDCKRIRFKDVKELKRIVREFIKSITPAMLGKHGVSLISDFKLCVRTAEKTWKYFSFLVELLLLKV